MHLIQISISLESLAPKYSLTNLYSLQITATLDNLFHLKQAKITLYSSSKTASLFLSRITSSKYFGIVKVLQNSG